MSSPIIVYTVNYSPPAPIKCQLTPLKCSRDRNVSERDFAVRESNVMSIPTFDKQ